MRLVFLDTETNDHPSKGAALRIVSITWLIARLDGTVEKIEDYIIRPDGFRIAYGAEQIHKISEAHARKHGHPVRDVLSKLVHDLMHPQGMTMVCHNVRFDRDVIGYELQRHGIPFDIYSLPSFDTMKSSASICQLPKARGSGYKDPKLQELHAYLFGKEFKNAHTSKADVEATARCFFELRRRGLFGEIGRSVAIQQAEQNRAQLASNNEIDIAKKIRPLSDAVAKVTKTPPARVEPAKQQAIAMVKPMASAEPAKKMTIPQPVVAPPAKQHTGTMLLPTPNVSGSTPAAANKIEKHPTITRIELCDPTYSPPDVSNVVSDEGSVSVDSQSADEVAPQSSQVPVLASPMLQMVETLSRLNKEKEHDVWLAFKFSNSKDEDSRIACLQETLQVNPQSSDTWYQLGLAYSEIGMTHRSIDVFHQALHFAPNDINIWHALISAYFESDKDSSGVEPYPLDQRIPPKDAGIWCELGLIFLDEDDSDQAIEAFQQALRIDPENSEYLYWLGAAYSSASRRSEALDVYARLQILDAEQADEFYQNILSEENEVASD